MRMIDKDHAVFPLFCLECGKDFQSKPVRLPLPDGHGIGSAPAPGFCSEHTTEGAAWLARMKAIVASAK